MNSFLLVEIYSFLFLQKISSHLNPPLCIYTHIIHACVFNQIDIADDEEIIEINGKVATFENLNLVTQLTFVTNKQTYGPYGTNGGTDFSCPIAKGKVVGFFGRYGAYLDAIGVVLSP
ncbi:putative jacalin-like lectin domain-containing protein [Helianthus annuus]|nr:putative jacalin-like lectin domain-containing protein [Helianthus annuus]